MSRSVKKLTARAVAGMGVVAASIALTLPASAGAAPVTTGKPAAPGCSTPLLSAPQRAADVAKNNPGAFTSAARRNQRSDTALAAEAQRDNSLWLDRCGQAFFVEQQVPKANRASGAMTAAGSTATGSTTPATAMVPLADTFTLQSRPGSNRTIYLDFKGGTVTNTAWNGSYGSSITVEPYSITAPADTAFTDAELTEIQHTWQVVAEDYAAFDVNVTTMDPGIDAIDRSSSTDMVYGAHVMITNSGPIYTNCGCGGISYVGVYNLSGTNHLYYQPAWVFSAGTGTSGKNMGEAAAHEVGHQFGLHHDGTSTAGYYTGATPWAPIMGAGYYQPVTQWSKGEYPDANNTEDDLAIIATGAPLRTDDFGDTPATAASLSNGTPLNGVIGSRTDVDAFTFTAAGATTLTATPAWMGDVDIQMTVLDSTGATVATINPLVSKVSSSQANGLGATWSVTLPSTASTYTVLIDGVGTGDPLVAGQYSDYASIGNYQLALSTQSTSTPSPLALSTSTPPAATLNVAYSATPVTASGGTSPYTFSASGVPAGLSINATTGAISGTPTAPGTYPVTVTVTDAAGAVASASISIVVNYPPVTVSAQTFNAVLKKAFSAQVKASGGDGTYAWSGTAPSGFSFSSTGVLSGTPLKTGTFTFTATVTSAGRSASALITIKVARR